MSTPWSGLLKSSLLEGSNRFQFGGKDETQTHSIYKAMGDVQILFSFFMNTIAPNELYEVFYV